MSSHFVYLARCADGSLYCGTCMDLAERERTHNEGKGAKYTRSRLPVTFVYHEACENLSAARRREADIKKWPRARKVSLINAASRVS